jgi:hypothetical protein
MDEKEERALRAFEKGREALGISGDGGAEAGELLTVSHGDGFSRASDL